MTTTTITHKETETVVKYIFPTVDLPDLIASQCAAGGYQAQIQDEDGKVIDNPITAKAFAWSRIKQFALNDLNFYRKNVKVEEAVKDITVDEIEVTGLDD